MATIAELKAQKEEIEKKIKEAMKSERKEAIVKAQAIITEFELTSDEVFGKKRGGKSKGVVAAKYKDPITGATWSGRGRPPKWLEGKNKKDFAI